jgi:uncharacterized protein (TIGR01777 family)
VRFVRRVPAPAAVRDTAARDAVRWDPTRAEIDRDALEGADAVVHLAGEGIGAKRWSAAQKRRVLESRVAGTTLIATTLASMKSNAVLVSASAVGYYGLRGDQILTESSTPGTGFLAEVCKAWEAATQPAADAGIRVVKLRTGIVLGRDGALKRLLPFFRLGVGGRLGTGKQWWSWISLADTVGLIRHAITSANVVGPMNVTGPDPATNADVSRALGRVLHRPAVVPVPSFALSLAMGPEFAREVILASQRALPTVALETGYSFRHPDLDGALAASLGR